MLQDEQIIDLYFERDERALTETSDKYGNYCRTIARNILNDEETVKECFNDTLFESWKAMPPTRPSCLRVFVGKITRNLSLNRVRSAQTLPRESRSRTGTISPSRKMSPSAPKCVKEMWN